MIRVFEDAAALAEAVAEDLARAVQRSLEARPRFRLGLSGGTTPTRLFQRLSSAAFRGRIDWPRVEIFFADERAVPPDHPDSNYRMVRETLVAPAGIPAGNVRRMHGEAEDLVAAAREYQSLLLEPLDVLLLGMGPDGHTASIFPGSAAAGERLRRVLPVTDSPKPPPRRLTVTARVLEEARAVWVMASGDEKADAVAAALEGDAEASVIPARLARAGDWYLDRAAAARLAPS